MLLTIEDLIKLLRESVNVDTEDITDPEYLAMSDEDLLRFIKLGVTRMYPSVTSLEELPSDCSEYAIVLLAKIELYLKLAVSRAEKVDLGADGAYIKNTQRFEHYMKLVEETRQEYENWLDNEGKGTVTTYELLNSKYSHTKRNYENQVVPTLLVRSANITSDSFDISWSVQNISHFGKYAVYICEEPIFSLYADGSNYNNHINKKAKLVRETYDKKNSAKHFEGLEEETTYYILVIAQCRNGVYGYKEISVQTISSVTDGEEIDI